MCKQNFLIPPQSSSSHGLLCLKQWRSILPVVWAQTSGFILDTLLSYPVPIWSGLSANPVNSTFKYIQILITQIFQPTASQHYFLQDYSNTLLTHSLPAPLPSIFKLDQKDISFRLCHTQAYKEKKRSSCSCLQNPALPGLYSSLMSYHSPPCSLHSLYSGLAIHGKCHLPSQVGPLYLSFPLHNVLCPQIPSGLTASSLGLYSSMRVFCGHRPVSNCTVYTEICSILLASCFTFHCRIYYHLLYLLLILLTIFPQLKYIFH